MRIGTVREIKRHEYRVGLTPSCVRAFVGQGHKVLVEEGCGMAAGFANEEYVAAGGQVMADRRRLYDACDMIVKVKEPQPQEFDLFHPGQILYAYLHLAADAHLLEGLMRRGVHAVAYETIEENGRLPCLQPMSAIAGRMSVQEGARQLEKPCRGRGILLGGVPGVRPGRVTILGGGVVGANACRIALGMGADVTVLDIDAARMEYLEGLFDMRVTVLYNNPSNLETALAQSDLLIGAVLVPAARTPVLVRREHLGRMKKGAVIVDVAVDQGGCVETTRPTTHDDPVFEVDGIIHYCVANMPGAVPLTSTLALTGATLPYGLLIAAHGLEEACRRSLPLRRGLNIYRGKCANARVAQALNQPCSPPETCLNLE